MRKEITVDKVVKRWVSLGIIMIVSMIITFILLVFLFDYFQLPLVWLALIINFSLGGVLLYLVWKRWLFWGFTRVQNVHELKKRLIAISYISENSKFFKKIENCTEEDKKYWKLRLRFTQNDISDNKTIPDETIIYFSKTTNWIFIVSSIFTFAVGVFLLTINDTTLTIFGVIALIISVYRFYKEYMKLKKREPQIILNNKGIETVNTDFYKWGEIGGEKIGNQYFTYEHPRGKESIYIADLDINPFKLSELLVLYRERSKLQTKEQNSNRVYNPVRVSKNR